MKPQAFRFLIVGLSLVLLGGCSREAPPTSDLPTISVRLGDQMFTLEVAADETSRQRGLMFRHSIPDDHGMIFVFEQEQPLSFWMKNTFIPLDILFIDADRRVISIHAMQPHDLRGVRSPRPAKYAIEINAGMARKAGVKSGDRIDLPENLRALE